MLLTPARSVAGIALLAVLAAGCGTAAAAHSAAPKSASAHHHHHAAPMHAMASTPAAQPGTAPVQPANSIPQGNGGDQDADNNGGPSDGDGSI